MSYCSVQDVREALTPGGLATDPTTGASLSDAQIQDAIAEADATIDSYIGRFYTTPVIADPANTTRAPAPIWTWSRNIAAYLATLTFRRGQELPPTNPVALRYAATMTALTAVRDGKATLPLQENSQGTGAVGMAGAAINPYTGNLWSSEDWDLVQGDYNTLGGLGGPSGWPRNVW